MQSNGEHSQLYTVKEAARVLGKTPEAIRARMFRGTLERVDTPEGVRVRLTDDQTRPHVDQSQRGQSPSGELVEILRDEIAHLRRESERKDEIIMSLSLSNAEMSRTIRAIEAPTSTERGSEPRESPESPGPTHTPTDAGEGPQEGTERPWWRRVFGG